MRSRGGRHGSSSVMAPAHETRVLVAFDAPTMPSQIKVSQTHKIKRCLLNIHGVGVEIEIHMDTCCDVGCWVSRRYSSVKNETDFSAQDHNALTKLQGILYMLNQCKQVPGCSMERCCLSYHMASLTEGENLRPLDKVEHSQVVSIAPFKISS